MASAPEFGKDKRIDYMLVKLNEIGIRATRDDADKILDTVWSMIVENTALFGKVWIPKLGTFRVKHRKSRVCNHPRYGTKIKSKAKNFIAFREHVDFANAIQEYNVTD